MKKYHICLEDFKARNGEIYVAGEKIDSWQYCNLSFLERLNFREEFETVVSSVPFFFRENFKFSFRRLFNELNLN